MCSASSARALTLDLALRPYELMAAFRPESRNLVLVVQEPVHVHQRVQARISVLGHDVGATIVGSAASAHPHPFGVELELEPDALKAPALERLVEVVASGARVSERPRAPRWVAELPAFVYRLYHFRRTTTFDVSESGCGLRWPGPAPPIGAAVQVHVGTGLRVAGFCAEVRWTAGAGRAPAVGLRFDAGDRKIWGELLADLRSAGAPLT